MAGENKSTIRSWIRDKAVVLALLGMACTSIGWAVQYHQTVQAEKRAYALEQIGDFKTSAAELDEITAELFDALADEDDPSALRSEFRKVYRRHVTLAEADREVLGVESTERYLAALGVLRDEVERAENASGAGDRVEALANVIVIRRTISDEALDI